MGVDIGALAPKEEISIESLAGKTVVIDGNNALYQFLATIRQRDGTPLLDSQGRVTSHLSGLFHRTARLVAAGVKPIYVFDGKPPAMKKKTLDARREIRDTASEKWTAALKEGDFAVARASAVASTRLTSQMIDEAKKLLGIMQIPFVQAASEGEAQAAVMCERGDAWASSSQDYDSLLFGTPRLVRNLTLAGRRKLPGRNDYTDVVPEIIELEKVLSTNSITREQLIWICILAGTDFNEGVKGIGPKKALKIVKESKTLAEAAEKSKGEFEIEPSEVEAFFLHPPFESNYEIKFGIPDIAELTKFLVEEHDFSKERVDGAAKAFSQSMGESIQQSKLDGWC